MNTSITFYVLKYILMQKTYIYLFLLLFLLKGDINI